MLLDRNLTPVWFGNLRQWSFELGVDAMLLFELGNDLRVDQSPGTQYHDSVAYFLDLAEHMRGEDYGATGLFGFCNHCIYFAANRWI